MRRWILCALAALPGCLTVGHERFASFEPPGPGVVAALEPGAVDLHACLEALGAPLLALEDPGGMALAWGWQRQANWFLTLSIPAWRNVNARLTYNSFVLKLYGVVGFFDLDGNLVELREGYLAELLDQRRVRPQLIDPRPAGGHE